MQSQDHLTIIKLLDEYLQKSEKYYAENWLEANLVEKLTIGQETNQNEARKKNKRMRGKNQSKLQMERQSKWEGGARWAENSFIASVSEVTTK